MGMGMGGNIQKADYPMVVFDIRDNAMQPFVKNGARAAGSPAEVAHLSDVVFTSLPGPKEVEEVATGASGVLEGIKPGGIYVDLSRAGRRSFVASSPYFGRRVRTSWMRR
jgi:3-hydroxyisobutyrate dehydrogenase